MTNILVINGSYRDDGITDKAIKAMIEVLEAEGANIEVVFLRKYPIEFCLNCRACTQEPGSKPGKCVQHDDMQELINKIEWADGYIFAAPTNFGSVTAIFKRFMERLIVYAYWPWGMNAPKYRKAEDAPKKKAVLISSCAAPSIMGRWLYGTHKQLKTTAKTIGAKNVGTLFIGLISNEPYPALPANVQKKIKNLAKKLVA